jgi:hypothetical protein
MGASLHSEMRKPEVPELDRYKSQLESRLLAEIAIQRRVIFPDMFTSIARHLKALVKPLVQSGAMAMTAIAVIIAVSATPAANLGDLVVPAETPLAAPSADELQASDSQIVDYLPPEDVFAMQIADNSDISPADME